LILKGISGFLSVFFPRFAPLTLKQAFRIVQMNKISGFQPEPRKVQPERLKENPFPTLDDDPLTLQHADAFIWLTMSPIALMPPSIPTPDEGVKTPSTADVRMTCFDGWLLAVPGLTLDASVRMLATFNRLVDVEVFSKKNFNMLIITIFCSQNVYKNLKDVHELTSFGCQFYFDNRFELRLEVCDKRRNLTTLVVGFFYGQKPSWLGFCP